jgi:hypothetical protein
VQIIIIIMLSRKPLLDHEDIFGSGSGPTCQPLDCNQLNTCPTDQCNVLPTSLNLHDSHGQSRILFVDYIYVQDLPTGGQNICPAQPPKTYDWNEEDRENCEESRDFALGTLCEWIPGFLKRANEACDVIRVSKIYQCYEEYPPDRHSYPIPESPAPNDFVCLLFPSECIA